MAEIAKNHSLKHTCPVSIGVESCSQRERGVLDGYTVVRKEGLKGEGVHLPSCKIFEDLRILRCNLMLHFVRFLSSCIYEKMIFY